MSKTQAVRKPLKPIQAARRKLFIQAIRDILPTTKEALRELEQRHKDENEEYLLDVTRDGFHIFNVEGEPVDYVPCDHMVYVISGTPFLHIPKAEETEESFKQLVEQATSLNRKMSLTCPMCGKPIHTGRYKAADPYTDIALVGCPRVVEGKVICMEYQMRGVL